MRMRIPTALSRIIGSPVPASRHLSFHSRPRAASRAPRSLLQRASYTGSGPAVSGRNTRFPHRATWHPIIGRTRLLLTRPRQSLAALVSFSRVPTRSRPETGARQPNARECRQRFPQNKCELLQCVSSRSRPSGYIRAITAARTLDRQFRQTAKAGIASAFSDHVAPYPAVAR
jgi:hypothetical protein